MTESNPTARDLTGDLPVFGIPSVPESMILWTRALKVAIAGMAFVLLDQLTIILMDLWLMESLGREEIFWTNFRTGAVLFVVGFVGIALGIARPTFTMKLPKAWQTFVRLSALLAGMVGGYLLAGEYLDFLTLSDSAAFGKEDPVFGNDIGFYVFELSALWTIWTAVALPFLLGLVSSAICAGLMEKGGSERGGMGLALGRMATPGTLFGVAVFGTTLAVGVWLARYNLLWEENLSSAIWQGAEYVDVEGLFSTLNAYWITGFVFLGLTAISVIALRALRRAALGSEDVSGELSRLGKIAIGLVAFDFLFACMIALRAVVFVIPNEPVIQIPYIERHIQATREGYNLTEVEVLPLIPNRDGDPIPTVEELMASPTLQNVPLWPGWASFIERVVDPQHADRVFLTDGDPMIYGPVLDIFRAQQKLRTYYDFLDIDTVRYEIDGEKRLFASSAREIPLGQPVQWLQWWGQRFLLFTHGYGLVMAPMSEIGEDGAPLYASSGIPADVRHPALKPGREQIYYGEGATHLAYSIAEGLNEFDRPDDEGRLVTPFEDAPQTGIVIDSALKRFVFGWSTGKLLDIWFSDMITGTTRVHYHRMPIERAERMAPFLYFDTNPIAIATQDSVVWMVNGISATNYYPYSLRKELGDKGDERSIVDRPEPWRNYIRDSVKITVDAFTGEVTYYQISDDPITQTWADIYPGLFKPIDEMPAEIRKHLQYPGHMLHTQFDDVYKRFHMVDSMEFFNMEDLWDDGDEVMGPILAEGESITFSNEPHDWLAETRGALPASSEPTQFVKTFYFTPEKAPNLRSIVMAYQDGDDYGRLIDLRVPKGLFYPSPEQADAAIDQAPEISEQISWWNRVGAEVIHGHTNTLIIGNEVLYVAPLFIRSAQSRLSQMKRVVVVFRGHAADGLTLEDALRNAIEKAKGSKPGVIREARRPGSDTPSRN